MDSHDLTALTDYTKFCAVRFNFLAKKLLLIKPMRLMVQLYARQLFFRFFFTKKIKRQARAKNDVVFIFFYFACSSTPTADRHHSL